MLKLKLQMGLKSFMNDSYIYMNNFIIKMNVNNTKTTSIYPSINA